MKENSSLSTDERKILEVLAESEQGMDCREVANQSGMSLAGTYRLLSALHNKKLTTKTTVAHDNGLRVLLHAASPTGQQRLLPARERQPAEDQQVPPK
ncbi:helix-turn-helix domain-containing protein [Amycolatopsis minnesotensis]|uniref:HTH iclR-type domain-containing protein n=1 Tax=Amycolatopsis minnesotensis TaxID=337894 RepID=A0ABN2PY36_9PSEU